MNCIRHGCVIDPIDRVTHEPPLKTKKTKKTIKVNILVELWLLKSGFLPLSVKFSHIERWRTQFKSLLNPSPMKILAMGLVCYVYNNSLVWCLLVWYWYLYFINFKQSFQKQHLNKYSTHIETILEKIYLLINLIIKFWYLLDFVLALCYWITKNKINIHHTSNFNWIGLFKRLTRILQILLF